MEYMATAKHDRRLVSQPTYVAQAAQVITREAIVHLLACGDELVVSFNALRLKAWKTFSFPVITLAFVSARVSLVAAITHVFHAFLFATDILKGRIVAE